MRDAISRAVAAGAGVPPGSDFERPLPPEQMANPVPTDAHLKPLNAKAPISFEQAVHWECENLAAMLVAKNAKYGNSALNPVRIFSDAHPVEQILVRIDDKLSRIKQGDWTTGEDTILDLMGYLVLLRVAQNGVR